MKKCTVKAAGCKGIATQVYYSVVNGIRCNDAYACDACHETIQGITATTHRGTVAAS